MWKTNTRDLDEWAQKRIEEAKQKLYSVIWQRKKFMISKKTQLLTGPTSIRKKITEKMTSMEKYLSEILAYQGWRQNCTSMQASEWHTKEKRGRLFLSIIDSRRQWSYVHRDARKKVFFYTQTTSYSCVKGEKGGGAKGRKMIM